MQDRNRRASSIDGFAPRKPASRTIGFDAMKKPPEAFPGVGVTLSSYKPSTNATMSNRSFELPNPMQPYTEAPPRTKLKKSRVTKKKIAAIIVILLLIPTVWLGFKLFHNLGKVFHGNVLGILGTTKLKGEDTGHVNILLAGNSADDPLHQGAQLTDSIMILSINTKDNSGFMLSIPRDMWVDIPDYGHAKINETYVDGENEHFNENGYFPGGMGLLQKVIEQNFDINLDYYGLVDYNAFRDMVNAVGGIDLTIQSPDKRGLYDPSIDWTTHGPLVKLTNGTHTLNGQQALDLARARGDAYGSYGFPQSDFDRTQHQRQELLALRSKATSTGVIANPVRLSSLMDAIGNNIKTNFNLSEVHRAYDLTKNIPGGNIQSLSLNDAHGKNLLTNYTAFGGQSALIPAAGLDNFSDIQVFIKQMLSNNAVSREGATVVVLNGTDTSGVASKARQSLSSKGLSVTAIGDATTTQATSTIIDLSGGKMPATKQLLQQLYGNQITTTNPYPAYTADFIVIVGTDKLPKATNTTSQ